LDDLNALDFVTETIRQHKHWPKAPSALGRRMNKVAGVLHKIGIEIEGWLAKKTNRRMWTITRSNRRPDTPTKYRVGAKMPLLPLCPYFASDFRELRRM
jgi:hypothetical protein